jgi:hypothetical protein
MFICKNCNKELPSDCYYFNRKGGRNHACKECIKEKNRKNYNNSDEKEKRRIRSREYSSDPVNALKNKERGIKFYNSVRGRALTLLKSAQRRASKFSEPIDIDLDFILEKLNLGICEVTGIYFDFESPKETMKNPYSPSIDRRDSTKGYTKDNTQIVIWQYNLMKGEISEKELLQLCQIIVERNKNE